MTLHPGDHVCSLYATDAQLVTTVSNFLAEGLARGERCWYVPSGGELPAIRSAMERKGIDVQAQSRRSALHLLDSNEAYVAHGGFEPEQTMQVFNEAIEQALNDGFSGFRAAADMSWALELRNGAEPLIAYEALLRFLFSTSRATGLCLYDRRRMPLRIINGALATHPIVGSPGAFERNPFYDETVCCLAAVDESSAKVAQLDRSTTAPSSREARTRPPADPSRSRSSRRQEPPSAR